MVQEVTTNSSFRSYRAAAGGPKSSMHQLMCLLLLGLCTRPQAVSAQDVSIAPSVQSQSQSHSTNDTPPPTPASLKVVKLLWKSQPAGAATALRKALDQALSRGQLVQLQPHLAALDGLWQSVRAGDSNQDPRWITALAAQTIATHLAPRQDAGQRTPIADDPLPQLRQAIDQADRWQLADREFLLRIWLAIEPQAALDYIQLSLVAPQRASASGNDWLEILTLRGLENGHEVVAGHLLTNWQRLPPSVQVVAVEPLTHTASSMKQLISAIEAGQVPKDLLNTNHLTKWSAGKDLELKADIERVWGRMRRPEDSDRKAVVEQTLKLLSGGRVGHPTAGQAHFKRICAQCHRLHGEGLDVGPDITGNGRGSFEQLVSNVMDPSLVIGQAFMAKTVLASDGRVVSGVVAAEDDQRLTLKVQGGKLIEFNRQEDIDEIRASEKSLMPDGLEQQMTEQELLDLFAYLSLTRPLSAEENSTIPGTPASLLP